MVLIVSDQPEHIRLRMLRQKELHMDAKDSPDDYTNDHDSTTTGRCLAYQEAGWGAQERQRAVYDSTMPATCENKACRELCVAAKHWQHISRIARRAGRTA